MGDLHVPQGWQGRSAMIFNRTMMAKSEIASEEQLVLDDGSHILVHMENGKIIVGCVSLTPKAWEVLKSKVEHLLAAQR